MKTYGDSTLVLPGAHKIHNTPLNTLNSADPLSDFWEYTPGTDAWKERSEFPGT
ncbi:MAG TPA: hypothetical protein VFT78_11445 [Hanamia sp.]|nr:hypothetical protein [Hanamia sp.]